MPRQIRLAFTVTVLFHLLIGGVAVFATAAKEAEGARAFEGQTVSYTSRRNLFALSLSELVHEFEAQTGAKVEVDLQAVSPYWTKANVELSSRSPAYDVFDTTNANIPQWAQSGWIGPLDAYIEQTGREALEFDQIAQAHVDGVTFQGQIYALPTFSGAVIMYYRSDVLENFGIQFPPRTWDELLTVAKTIQSPEMAAVAMRGRSGQAHNVWLFVMVMRSFGGRIVRDYPDDMRPVLDTPEVIQAAKLYSDLLNNYSFAGATTAGWDEILVEMQQGRLAIMLEGAPLVNPVIDPQSSTVADKIAFARVPAGPAGSFAPVSTHGLAMNAASRNKDLAWEFIRWASSHETLLKAAIEQQHPAVPRVSVLNSPQYQQKYGFGGGSYLDAALMSMTEDAGEFYYPITPEWPQIADLLGTALSEVITGQKTAERAFGELNTAVEEIYRRAGYFN